MKPAPFEYHAPESLSDVTALLAEHGDEAKVLAGGQSLVPMLALRLTRFDHIIDLNRVDDLRGVSRSNGTLTINAMTTQRTVEHDAAAGEAVPLLAEAIPLIGHFQIRNRGTVGGSIAHADPAAEYPAAAVALDADMEVVSPRGRRTIPASDFFQGFWTSALAPDEVLTSVTFPVWKGRSGFGVREFARRHGDFAIAGALVGVQLDEDDRITRCAIGLIGLGATPLRAGAAEQAALGRAVGDVVPSELGHAAVSDLDEVSSDVHGSAAYRKRVGAAMVERAWQDAIEEAR
jgi:carbon-monoxide dehydrogenase medium subunit